MAVRHFSATGTRASGNSTPDDWTNANCFPISALQTQGFNWSTMVDGDEIILDDGTHTFASLVTGTVTAPGGTTIRMRSRSGSAASCTLAFSDGGVPSIRSNNGSRALGLLFTGIRFTKSVDHTVSGSSLIQLINLASGVDFVDCAIDAITNTYTNAGVYGHMCIYDGVAATLRFTRTPITNLTSSHQSGLYFGYVGDLGLISFIDCPISNITNTVTGTAHHCTGGIVGPGGLSVLGGSLTDCTSTSATVGDYAHESIFHPNGPCTIIGLRSERITNTGAKAGVCIAKMEGPYTISDTLSIDCVGAADFRPEEPTQRYTAVGGTYLAFGPGAQGTATRIRAIRCISCFGPAWYCSQGAGGVITDIFAEHCHARKEGIFYAGGWGDVTFDTFRIVGGETGSEPFDFEGWGGAIYAHNHTLSTRAKTTRILNGVIYGHRQLQNGDAAIKVRGINATYPHTVEISNVVIDNPGYASQIGIHESASCVINVSGSGIVLNGGASGITKVRNGIGVDTYAPVSALTTVNRPTRWGVSQGNAARRTA